MFLFRLQTKSPQLAVVFSTEPPEDNLLLRSTSRLFIKEDWRRGIKLRFSGKVVVVFKLQFPECFLTRQTLEEVFLQLCQSQDEEENDTGEGTAYVVSCIHMLYFAAYISSYISIVCSSFSFS